MFVMPVYETFNIKTRSGPVAMGKIQSGSVAVGETLFLIGKTVTRKVKVVSIEKFQKVGLSSAGAGPEDVGIEIAGVNFKDVQRGDILMIQ